MADNNTANDPPEVSVNLLETENLPMRSKPWKDVQLPIDILLLTVKECELLSCVSYLDPGFYKSHHTDLNFVYFGEMGEVECEDGGGDQAKKLKIAVIQCAVGSAGPKGSIVVVQNAVKVLKPKAVLCVGFCGGLKKVKLGDVVVSAKLRTYASIKTTESGNQDRNLAVPLNKRLLGLITSGGAHHGWKAPLKDPKQLKVKVYTEGVFLSGPEVVAKKKRREELTKDFPEAIAIEMEGEGLFAATHDLDVEWGVIKGVSDFADGEKSKTDSWKPFASTMAASVTAHMLKDPTVFQEWPHYGNASASEQSLKSKRKSPPAGSGTQATKRSR